MEGRFLIGIKVHQMKFSLLWQIMGREDHLEAKRFLVKRRNLSQKTTRQQEKFEHVFNTSNISLTKRTFRQKLFQQISTPELNFPVVDLLDFGCDPSPPGEGLGLGVPNPLLKMVHDILVVTGILAGG